LPGRAPGHRRALLAAPGPEAAGLCPPRCEWNLGGPAAARRGIGAGTRRPHHRIERRAGGGGAPRRALDGKALRRQPPARAGEDAGARRMKRPAGLQTIIVYKLAKSVVQALLGVAFIWLLARGDEAGGAVFEECLPAQSSCAWER